MSVRAWWAAATNSLWFLPAVFVLVSGALAFGVLAIDRAATGVPEALPLVMQIGADGARGLLSSIAGSMITVAGVTFSITIVALQLASSQFSPRVLRTFMRDRPSQLVLGTFIGAFTYAILVLRSVRGPDGPVESFVPSIGVSFAIVYALVALGMLVYFIHHIATQIQVSRLAATIAEDAVSEIRERWSARDAAASEDRSPSQTWTDPPGEGGTVASRESGYLQVVDREGLAAAAAERGVVLRLPPRPGEWVLEYAALAIVWPAGREDEMADIVHDFVTLGKERSLEQDAAYAIRQLVDIAIKALSPGINDPTTATECLDRISQVLVVASHLEVADAVVTDAGGVLRVFAPTNEWPELVRLGFSQLRHYSAGAPDSMLALSLTLERLMRAVPQDRRAPLVEEAQLLAKRIEEIPLDDDRRRVQAVVDRALAAAG
jgi:uncharacterized membrane protein